ncbi:C1 family peptidase [uncultured Methanobrevibacter sp.]|uniref:C1 family peptidase n=1 Tax=uncultured Methanobrevibacter sp. TaxID=253161 RepID=UPI0026071A40|nr:C1 family peptidase [uncultured Methanobrevibacter sp.]
MKFYRISIIFLILLAFSIGAVCAEDVNNATLDTTDSDVISAGDKTFTDLSNLINSSTSATIDIKDDYKFNSEKDTQKRIIIENSKLNYTFNGNNHVIDGSGSAGLFRIVNSTVTLKNLVIKNCNSSAIVLDNTVLNTVNVTFENNTDLNSAGSILGYQSTLTSNGDKFIDNSAKYGSSIYLIRSEFDGQNDLFTSKIPVNWAMLYGSDSDIRIANSVFANSTSRYATAIYNNYITVVKKSKFINLYANLTGGAIAIKGDNELGKPSQTIIQDCDFINITSAKNGGGLYIDIAATNERTGGVLINNSNFINCKSMFGGALLQLGGTLNIIYSNFENNVAWISGGAVYTSNTTTYVGRCDFTNNTAEFMEGGALFIDFGNLESELNKFIKNNATTGGAIYLYDSLYTVVKCDFADNGQAIYSCYDNKGSYQKNNNFGKDKVVIDQEFFETYVNYAGKQIILNPLKIEGSPSDSYFNLAKQGLVTPVRNQGSMGSCWAFGITGALESAFLIATNISLDISENNVQNLGLRYSRYGDVSSIEGGNYVTGSGYFLGWLGVVSTENDEYDELGKISPVIFDENAYHIVDAIFVNITDSQGLKDALTKYGALDLYIFGADRNTNYYNPDTHALYYNGNISGNHYVTLVGWDDNYPADNFKIKPEGNGAWICKNSWGTDWGENGYFYLSYYDNSLKIGASAVGFVINNTQLYNHLYQYDVCGFSESYYTFKKGQGEYMNVYYATDENLIAAVGTYFENANENYTITVYVNGSEMYSQSGKSAFFGFNTIKLNQYILINEGDNFAVKIKCSSAPLLESSRIIFQKDVSFIDSGSGMYDTSNDYLVVIKAYTVENPTFIENIKQYYSEFNKFIAYSDLEGAVLTLKQNGTEIAKATVKDGEANFGVVLKPGMYALHNPVNGTTIISNVEILSTIQIPNEITIGYNTQLKITPTFIDDWGNELKGVEITYKFDNEAEGKIKTDENGELTFEVLQGTSIGTHKLAVNNPVTGENLTITINIVSRFVGNKNIAMYYYDGSKYSVRIVGDDGKFVSAGKFVSIKIGSKTFNVKTDKDGYATLTIPNTITVGKYTVVATYEGQSVKNTLQVKQVLKSTKTVTVKKSAKKLVLKATLKGKTALKNKVVKFKVNGKTYSGKTNSKGIAKVTIKKSALNKLKAGKKYTVTISYLKNTIKTTLKVKR